MGDVINLKRFRKRVEREQSSKQAEANRARPLSPKPPRPLHTRPPTRPSDLLDQHRTDGEDAS